MRKYSLMLVIVAALLLEVMGGAQYFLATYGTEAELLEKASRDMDQSLRVAAVKSEVESALRNIVNQVEASIDTPANYYRIANRLVINNPHIVGAGVAFSPDYYKQQGKGRLYAPYVYDRQPDVTLKKKKTAAPMVTSILLPFDYTDREWFNKPIADGKSLWTRPYVDQGGTHIIMCTYVMPVHDKNGTTVGVFFADVPMEDVSLLSIDMYNGINSSRKVLFFIQVVSLIIIGFIIWMAVKSFKRYKGRYVDPEKSHLVEEIERLKEVNTRLKKVNTRLTKRNQDLAEKVAQQIEHPTTNTTTTNSYTSSSTW